MKMFICDQQENGNAFTGIAGNEVVKADGLNFRAQGKVFVLKRNKNLIRKIFAAIIVASIFASCSKDVVHGDGNVVTSERNISNFSGIDIQGANNVYITYAPTVSVSVKGYDNLVPHYVTEVREGKLYLYYDDNTNVSNDNVQVYITMPSFDALSLSGTSTINASGNYNNTENLAIETSGNGNVNIQDISADVYTVHSSGNNNISTLGVKAKTARVEISGSGAVTLSVQDKLDVHISGSGTVSYKGGPAEVNTDISGSGNVIKL